MTIRKISSTERYLSENKYVLTLPKFKLNTEEPKIFKAESLRWLLLKKIKEILNLKNYFHEIFCGRVWLRKTSLLRATKFRTMALVLGNGPSQGYLNEEDLKKFVDRGGEIFVVNNFYENKLFAKITPTYLVLSDPNSLNFSNNEQYFSSKSKLLKEYLRRNVNIKIFVPALFCNSVSALFGSERVFGFVDTEMRMLTNNISPMLPRGYVSLTLLKALSISIWQGYKSIYILGMDNTYPRNIYSNIDNGILNLEIHADADDSVTDLSNHYGSISDAMVDIYRIFIDIKIFATQSKCQILNLDPHSLTDAFQKIEFSEFRNKIGVN